MDSKDMADDRPAAPWPIRLYEASRRGFDTSVAAARAVFIGTWLGLLDRQSLHAADELYYRRTRMYHDDQYNLSGLFPWEQDVLERHFRGCRTLLVTAAGGGREVIALERRSFRVFAFECHPELVAVANDLLAREGLKARVILAPRDQCPSDTPTCDGVILGWSSYTLMQHRSVRVRFLQQLRARVPEGAPLLLSFFAREGTARQLRIMAKTANAFRVVRGRERAELGDDLAPNFVHRFSENELVSETHAGGFRLVEFSRDGYPHAVAVAASHADTSAGRA
jgi:hypothetical protein